MTAPGESESRPQGQIDTLGVYLREIGRHPLLEPNEEIELAKQVQAGMAIRQFYDSLPEVEGVAPLMPTPEEIQTMRQGEVAKERFINTNLRLVVSVAKKYPAVKGMEMKDLIQEGNLGLEHAVDKFDWRKGFRFSTYATFWIRQAIGKSIDKKSNTIHIPVRNAGEIRAALRISGGDIDALTPEQQDAHRLINPVSLDAPVKDDQNSASLGDLIADETALHPDDAAELGYVKESVRAAIDRLIDEERMLIEMRFLEGLAPMEIGAIIGQSAEKVRYKIDRAVSRMRRDKDLQLAFAEAD